MSTTGDPTEAEKIANKIVDEELAACVNVFPEIKSVYRWKGSVEKDSEAFILGKTTGDCLNQLIKRIKELHSYENPEILALEVEEGLSEYLDWVEKNVKDL